jgi:UDP-N-acetylmuramyl pentapeptide phosphotransferase/UDP-N-acetylglucosamine-1-phosphate transferase
MTLSKLLLLSPAAALGGWWVVRLVRLRAVRYLIDIPNARSSHTRPIPRGGGIGIVAVALVAWLALAAYLAGTADFANPVLPLAGAALLVALVSIVDDVRSVPSAIRFGVHALAAALVIAGYGVPEGIVVPLAGELPLAAPLAVGLTLLWCVGVTNIYNFMDGIDGIAGVQAVVAGAAWAVVGVILGGPVVAVTGTVIAAAALGFLGHNWSPARIFMGDVGSAFLGFTFAALVLVAGTAAGAGDVGGGAVTAARLPVAAILFLWPFLFDGTFTLLRRALRGENIFQAHRSHLYQRRVIAGRSHASTATFYGVLAAISAAAGVYWVVEGAGAGWVALGVAVAEAVLLLRLTGRWESKCDCQRSAISSLR